MAILHILRGLARSVRPEAGIKRLLPALLMLHVASSGCWSDIPYDPTTEGQPPSADSGTVPPAAQQPDTPPEVAVSNEPVEPEPEPEPQTQPEPANATLPLAESAPVDLFADVAEEPERPIAPAAPATSDERAETEQPSQPVVEDTTNREPADSAVASSEAVDDDDFFESIIMGPDAKPEPESEEAPEPTPNSEIIAEAEPAVEPEPETVAESSEGAEATAPEPLPETTESNDADVSTFLPWLTEDSSTTSPETAEEPAPEEPAPIAPTDSSDLLWGTPSTAPSEPAPTAVATSELPDVEATETAPTQPPDTRELTWLLASRLSYLLVAPETEMNIVGIEEELLPVAEALELPWPTIKSTKPGSADQLKQVLSVGRELGKSAADKYGMEYAALVEIAFKSNMLLAIAESRPQLKHSISGSVAAAAVRAGLPESVWQPFQDHLADSSEPDELASAVVELHKKVGSSLKQSQLADPTSAPPVLR